MKKKVKALTLKEQIVVLKYQIEYLHGYSATLKALTQKLKKDKAWLKRVINEMSSI